MHQHRIIPLPPPLHHHYMFLFYNVHIVGNPRVILIDSLFLLEIIACGLKPMVCDDAMSIAYTNMLTYFVRLQRSLKFFAQMVPVHANFTLNPSGAPRWPRTYNFTEPLFHSILGVSGSAKSYLLRFVTVLKF